MWASENQIRLFFVSRFVRWGSARGHFTAVFSRHCIFFLTETHWAELCWYYRLSSDTTRPTEERWFIMPLKWETMVRLADFKVSSERGEMEKSKVVVSLTPKRVWMSWLSSACVLGIVRKVRFVVIHKENYQRGVFQDEIELRRIHKLWLRMCV